MDDLTYSDYTVVTKDAGVVHIPNAYFLMEDNWVIFYSVDPEGSGREGAAWFNRDAIALFGESDSDDGEEQGDGEPSDGGDPPPTLDPAAALAALDAQMGAYL